MRHKDQNFYFHNLTLDKLHYKELDLSKIIELYLNLELNQEYILKKDEKKIQLIEVKEVETGKKYILKYEIFRYGKKKKIKNIDTKKEEGVLGKRQSVEDYQYICIEKVDKDSYDITIQGKTTGLKFNQFYTMICNFYNKIKNEELKDTEELGDTMIRMSTYHNIDFLEKIKNFNVNRVDVVSEVDDNLIELDIDKNFADRFELSAKLSFNIIKKRMLKDKKIDISEKVKEIKKKYPSSKIVIKGLNAKKEKDKIFSDELSYSKCKKIQLNKETNDFEESHLEKVISDATSEFKDSKKRSEFISL